MYLPRFLRKHLALKRIARAHRFNLASLAEDLRGDEELVLKSLPLFPWNFEHAAETLRSDPAFLRRAIEINPNVLKYAPAWVQEDKAYVLLAAGGLPETLRFADAKFLDDKDVVLLAIAMETRWTGGGVSESPTYAIASERLRQDAEVKAAAAEFSAQALRVADWHARR